MIKYNTSVKDNFSTYFLIFGGFVGGTLLARKYPLNTRNCLIVSGGSIGVYIGGALLTGSGLMLFITSKQNGLKSSIGIGMMFTGMPFLILPFGVPIGYIAGHGFKHLRSKINKF